MENEENFLPFEVYEYDKRIVIGETFLIRAVWEQLADGVSPAVLAARFMNTLTEAAAAVCLKLRETHSFRQIVLSGGTFQNLYLLKRLSARLKAEGFSVYHHRRVSANDEGVCLGQLLIAKAALARGKKEE